ncbi:MAG TPA: M48 family metallopeptidase [Gemmataceae bacterium]|jgi:Zn-dependent protease with chaperone function|nr:M48 family metallopeptidase [Gemmataceae bacterium]
MPYAVKDELAGKRTKCLKCQAPLQVPIHPTSETATPVDKAGEPRLSNKELMAEILDAFEGEAPLSRSSVAYRLGMLCAALALLLLPALYIGVIAAAGSAVYLHAVHNYSLVRWGVVGVLLYAAPLFAGCVVVIFMIKPLFSRPPRAGRERFLQVGKEPLIFAFVARVARCVHAPQPKQICVDHSINASASYGSFLGGLFGGDLVLTIGLPLVSGLDARQLAGVLAHELGHLAQSQGMRLSFLVRSINGWFARVVYERDSMDVALIEQSQAGGWGSLIALFARLCVGTVRGILWLWMIAAHFLSCYLLRQMERDADRYEIVVAGSNAFETTSRRLVQLNLGAQVALSVIQKHLTAGKLPDNLPSLIVAEADSLPDKLHRKMEKVCLKEKTGFFDTHPAMRERVDQARRAKEPGLFILDRPAEVLFAQLEKHQRAVSKAIYRQMIGRNLERMEMIETVSALVRASDQ